MKARAPLTAVILAAAATIHCSAKTSPDEPTTFRIALLADTHLIDSYYVGPENSPLDTESILHSVERLTATTQVINRVQPPVERIFVAGDIIHDYGSKDRAFYDHNRTVFDIARELFGAFKAPVFLGFGNHDYSTPDVSMAMTEELFKTKLGVPAPYYVVDYKGWRFIHLNCFKGNSTGDYGSFGSEQLAWLESQLVAGMPAVLIFHIPLPFIQQNEVPGNDLFKVIDKHSADVKMIIAGHWHLWFDLGAGSGAPHMVVASTRYDQNAFAIADLTTDTHQFRFIHPELWHMQEHETDPWPVAELK